MIYEADGFALQGTHVLRDFQRKKLERQQCRDRLQQRRTDNNGEAEGGDDRLEGEDCLTDMVDGGGGGVGGVAGTQSPLEGKEGSRIPRKLTFVQSDALFPDECEEEEENSQHVLVAPPSPAPPVRHMSSPTRQLMQQGAAGSAVSMPVAAQIDDNLLHLDLSIAKDMQQQAQQQVPKSAPPPASSQQQGPASITSSNSKNSFHFNTAEK